MKFHVMDWIAVTVAITMSWIIKVQSHTPDPHIHVCINIYVHIIVGIQLCIQKK